MAVRRRTTQDTEHAEGLKAPLAESLRDALIRCCLHCLAEGGKWDWPGVFPLKGPAIPWRSQSARAPNALSTLSPAGVGPPTTHVLIGAILSE